MNVLSRLPNGQAGCCLNDDKLPRWSCLRNAEHRALVLVGVLRRRFAVLQIF